MTVLRSAVLGGVDGVITSFAIIAGTVAGELEVRGVFIVGLSSVLADGVSMGVSEFLSSWPEVGARAALQGLWCFATFVACGAVPVAAFLVSESLLSSAILASSELVLLGATQSVYAERSVLFGVLQTTLLGLAAGGVAFGTGRLAAVAW